MTTSKSLLSCTDSISNYLIVSNDYSHEIVVSIDRNFGLYLTTM